MRLVFSVKENRGTPVSIVIELIRHWFSLDELKQFKDDESLKAFGKSFIDVNIIQQAMEVKEPSPHIAASITEFSRYISINEPEKAKTVLLDLSNFSEELQSNIELEVMQLISKSQSEIKGKNLDKRLLQVKSILNSLPTVYKDIVITTCFVNFCDQFQLIEKEKVKLIKSLLINDGKPQTLGKLIVFCSESNISANALQALCKNFGISISRLTGMFLHIRITEHNQQVVKHLEYFKKMITHCDFVILAIYALSNELIKDEIFFERFLENTKIKNSEILALSSVLVKMKKNHSLAALIKTVLENRKNESIYQTVLSLKAYSESGDIKLLMTLPKEMRSLILDNQSEQNND